MNVDGIHSHRTGGNATVFVVSDSDMLPAVAWPVLVKLRARFQCETCPNRYGRLINAHHVDLDRKNNRLGNGVALCTDCHTEVHNRLRGHGYHRGAPTPALADVIARAAPALAA